MLRNSHHRWLAISVVVALATIVPSRTFAQSSDATTGLPRTSWGDPDLQGVWTNDTITPFERPSRLADQEFFTEQEIAETQQRARDRLADATRATTPTTEALPVSRSSGSYSPLWYGPLDRMVRVGARRWSSTRPTGASLSDPRRRHDATTSSHIAPTATKT